MATLYDKTGREILRGDILKVYHFTSALRRKRHYMYKQVLEQVTLGRPDNRGTFLKLDHLAMDGEYYHEFCDGRALLGYEIVQSIKCDHEDRPRNLEAVKAAEQASEELHADWGQGSASLPSDSKGQ